MSRFFTAWATTLFLMSAAIKEMSEHIPTTPPVGSSEVVLLDRLPEARRAGIGVSILHTARQAHRGKPGASMGLEPGDVITHVNGVSLQGIRETEMHALLIGPEGTKIDLEIIDIRTGGTLTRSSRRRYIDSRY